MVMIIHKVAFGREFLKGLNLDKNQIDSIMDEHGKRIGEFQYKKAELERTQRALAELQSGYNDLQGRFIVCVSKLVDALFAVIQMKACEQQTRDRLIKPKAWGEEAGKEKEDEDEKGVTKSSDLLG